MEVALRQGLRRAPEERTTLVQGQRRCERFTAGGPVPTPGELFTAAGHGGVVRTRRAESRQQQNRSNPHDLAVPLRAARQTRHRAPLGARDL